MRRKPSSARRGVALIWAVVILVLLTILTGAVIGHISISRRQLERRQNQLQAEWLARAGIELAAARLLTQAAGFTDESLELIERSRIRIEAKSDPNSSDTFEIKSEARYPTDSHEPAECSLARRFRRTIEKARVRLEVVAEATP